jgi:hypothetical protein
MSTARAQEDNETEAFDDISREPVIQPTPMVVGFVRNVQGTPYAIPSICRRDTFGPETCVSNTTSGWFKVPHEQGVQVQAAANEVIIGITPIPNGGRQVITGNTAAYYWPQWVTGRKDVKFIVAAASPTPTPPIPAWTPPTQPDLHDEGLTYTSTQFISHFWEPLRLQHPTRISRAVAGLDASGTKQIWRYVFNPTGTIEKTFVVILAMHGGESMNSIAYSRFLGHVLNDSGSHAGLAYLNEHVRFVVVPMLNPWGHDQRWKRTNANGVDINRNFPYRWNEYPDRGLGATDYKGPSAGSEAETQIVTALLNQYDSANTIFFDIHNGGSSQNHYTSYTPYSNQNWTLVNRVINWFWVDGEMISRFVYNYPLAVNYAYTSFGVTSFTPEFPSGRYGPSSGPVELGYAVRWYGNLTMQYAKPN